MRARFAEDLGFAYGAITIFPMSRGEAVENFPIKFDWEILELIWKPGLERNGPDNLWSTLVDLE